MILFSGVRKVVLTEFKVVITALLLRGCVCVSVCVSMCDKEFPDKPLGSVHGCCSSHSPVAGR